jgi:hypothetical protein
MVELPARRKPTWLSKSRSTDKIYASQAHARAAVVRSSPPAPGPTIGLSLRFRPTQTLRRHPHLRRDRPDRFPLRCMLLYLLNTSTTARSRTSRGCLDNRAITLSFTRPGAVRYAGTQKRRSGPQGAHLLGSARRRPPDSCKSEWIVTMRHRDTGDWDAINRMI